MFHGPEHRILDLHVKPTWQSTTTTSCTITRREHIMSTTNNLESTHGLGSLKKAATRAVFAGGLNLAVIGLGTGTAHAFEVGLWCPINVKSGSTGTVCISTLNTDHPCPTASRELDALDFWVVTDAESGQVRGRRNGLGPITITWPASPGQHMLNLNKPGSANVQSACVINVLPAATVNQGDWD
jgi:hypothetical protein